MKGHILTIRSKRECHWASGMLYEWTNGKVMAEYLISMRLKHHHGRYLLSDVVFTHYCRFSDFYVYFYRRTSGCLTVIMKRKFQLGRGGIGQGQRGLVLARWDDSRPDGMSSVQMG